MEYFDFSACVFINERMRFYTYYDFCDNCERIKKHYRRLDKNAKIFYKYYVYANLYCKEYFKDRIWEYLNNDEFIYEVNLMEAKRFYKVK